MTEKVLLVDDDPNILSGYKRILQSKFDIEVARDGKQGLEMVDQLGPFAVVVADISMPIMDGIKFMVNVKQYSLDTVRMMLSGTTDLTKAIKAVNEGDIFRFLIKPCPPDTLASAITAGIQQYKLVTERKEVEEERERLILELQDALDKVKTLSGLLPICCHCKKIRDDKGYWNQLEFYIAQHSDAQFSHGLCPDCLKKYYNNLIKKDK